MLNAICYLIWLKAMDFIISCEGNSMRKIQGDREKKGEISVLNIVPSCCSGL